MSTVHPKAPASRKGAPVAARRTTKPGSQAVPADSGALPRPVIARALALFALFGRSSVLRHRHFRHVVIAGFVSNVGGWMEMVGIQMIVAKTTGSLKMLGYFAAAQLLPILFLGIFGGLVADRVNRKKLLVATQAMLMLIAAGVAVAAYWQHRLPEVAWLARRGHTAGSGLVAALFLLSIAQGVVMAFNIPAWQVLTPRLVPKDELTRAITLNGIQFNAARVVGPALAGVILGAFGATPLFVFNTVTFLGVLIAVSTTPDAPAPPQTDTHPWRQVREAAAFIFLQKGPLCVFMAMVLMSLLAAPLMRMLPLYVIDVYGVSEARADLVTGWLISILGVGAVLGGFALALVPRWYPKHHFIPLAITGAGLSITLFGLTTGQWAGYATMFIVGLFWIWGFNPAWAAMQHLVSDGMRGRVMAIANVASFGVTAIGNVAAGWLGEGVEAILVGQGVTEWLGMTPKQIGTHSAVAGLSAVLLAAGFVMLIWRVPEVDGLRPGDPEHTPRRSLWAGITARTHLEHDRSRRGLCPRCGQDLRETGGSSCPACGTEVEGADPVRDWDPGTHAGAK